MRQNIGNEDPRTQTRLIYFWGPLTAAVRPGLGPVARDMRCKWVKQTGNGLLSVVKRSRLTHLMADSYCSIKLFVCSRREDTKHNYYDFNFVTRSIVAHGHKWSIFNNSIKLSN